jgi:hypothetical protein
VIESLKDSKAKSKDPALVPIYREARRIKLSSLNKESKLFKSEIWIRTEII